MSVEVPDRAERARALDPTRSFIVQAPAGSGKTELLIQRYLLLLARVERPEEIVAITFTRKATAEMRKRVLDALAFARGEPRPAERHEALTWDLARAALEANQRLGWKLEENAARLRVQTIDALCASLTRRTPIVSRFGAQPDTIDDATAHYFEAARNVVAAVEVDDDERAPHVAHLLRHLDNHVDTAVALIADMLASRDHWIRPLYEKRDRAALEAALAAVRAELAGRCRALYPDGPETPDQWQAFAKSLLTTKHTWRKADPLARSLEGEEPLRLALKAMYDAPPAAYTDDQWDALATITELLPYAIVELRNVFAAHGQCDFVEVSQGAVRALGGPDGPTDLLLALDYRIRHLLVDEFQDTSHSQYELLSLLTAGWEPGDGRTLFVVGDPMQSIYRFRQAEVGLFLDARHSGLATVPVEPIRLRANFRSQPAIVRWVNDAFRRILPAEDDVAAGAVGYAASTAMTSADGPEVHVHPFFDDDRVGEAACVVSLVRKARERNPGGSVAILVRSRSRLDWVVRALRSAGLSFRAVEIELLSQRTVVQDLLALTRALSHLADRTAWLSVLRAPWCGLKLEDLCRLGERGAPWDALNDEKRLAALSADGRARALRVRDGLAPLVEGRMRSSLRDAVEGAWLALGGSACVEGDTDLADADAYLDFLESSEHAGAIANTATFERRLEKLYASPDLAADEKLQVMTIHKAKGLEFDTVILPGLGAGTDPDKAKLFMWLRRRETSGADLLVGPLNATGSDDDLIYKYIRRLDRAHAEHEIGRVLYVGATRAREELHLCGDVKRGAGEIKPKGGSLLKHLWPTVQPVFVPPEGSRDAHAASPAERFAQPLRRVAMPVSPVAWPPAVASDVPAEETRTQEIEFSWAGQAARRVGAVAHRWMQRIAEEGLERWNPDRVRGMAKVFRANLVAMGVGDRDLDAAARSVERALVNALEDERGRWILGAHREASNECRLTLDEGGVRRSLIVDRHFLDEEGTRWIVDYKTSRHEGSGAEAFLDQERERYREQLARYARLFEGASRQALYFPLMPGWREM